MTNCCNLFCTLISPRHHSFFFLVGGFKNRSALGIYLCYGFDIVGIYCGTVLMILKDLDDFSISRAVGIMKQKTEALYLLPVLKERAVPRDDVAGPSTVETDAMDHEESDIQASQTSTAVSSALDKQSQVWFCLLSRRAT